MTAALAEGGKAPKLELPATGESNLKVPTDGGLVLFFYPKDNTPGCTNEAKDFSALKADFAEKGYEVVGISRDSLASHEKFIAKQELTIRLASDEDGAACEAFGVWVEKNMYGRKYMGIERSTFIISPDGVIRSVWRKVKVKEHAKTVLTTI
ncbi:peroxiredoxin [Henriciella sp. AS95]|uniref:peroxiredoxin n=1 Tax=Henriciella sp. AS95 TaxID=3135782 RepID=UPI003172C383